MSEKYIIPTPGDVVAGKYHIERELGRGAYGVVFRARQEGIGRYVALKTLLPKAFLENDIVERFEREAKFVGRLNHPNVVGVHDYGRHENLLYMAVEYVEGPTLEDIIAEEAPLEPERVRRLAYQMIDALEHARERGIVHRDLKPANIVVLQQPGSDGEPEVVKVLDFGIAKLIHIEADEEDYNTLTQAGTVLGTPHYMSPETIMGDTIDHRADIYSLGVIIYELLTGERPFGAKNSPGVMVKHLRDKPPQLPEHLEHSCWGEVVRGCMRKRPEKRLQSAHEIREILERRDEGQYSARAPGATTTAQRAKTKARRQRRGIIGAVAAGALVAVAIAAGLHFWTPTDRQDSIEPPDDRHAAAPRQASPSEPEQPAAENAKNAENAEDQPTMEIGAEEVEPSRADTQRPDAGRVADVGDDDTEAAPGDEPAGDPDRQAKPARAADDEKPDPPEQEHAERTGGDKTGRHAAGSDKRAAEPARADSTEADSTQAEPTVSEVDLTIEATPANSRVVLDGTPLGNAPVTHTLEASDEPHTLEISHLGYRTKYETVVPTEDRTIRVELEKGRLKLIP
ncbi:MAG: protein kinase domain-containing protein [Persicimonas sp.]